MPKITEEKETAIVLYFKNAFCEIESLNLYYVSEIKHAFHVLKRHINSRPAGESERKVCSKQHESWTGTHKILCLNKQTGLTTRVSHFSLSFLANSNLIYIQIAGKRQHYRGVSSLSLYHQRIISIIIS